MRATITSKDRVTLPKALREKLNLATGDCIEFVVDDDDSVRLVARHASIGRLKGALPKPGRPGLAGGDGRGHRSGRPHAAWDGRSRADYAFEPLPSSRTK